MKIKNNKIIINLIICLNDLKIMPSNINKIKLKYKI